MYVGLVWHVPLRLLLTLIWMLNLDILEFYYQSLLFFKAMCYKNISDNISVYLSKQL